MQIFWHGFTCVRIETESGEQEATLVTDPYDSEGGLRFPRTLAPDLAVLSHEDRKRFNMDGFTNQPFLISEPGEYEKSGVFVFGMAIKEPEAQGPFPVVYRFEIEGMSVGFLGGLERPLTETELGQLGTIDILLLPVGGGGKLTAKMAQEMIQAIEPRIVVPLMHHTEGVKEKLGTADQFCKELGVCKRQDANKLKISRKDLPVDDLLVAVLERA